MKNKVNDQPVHLGSLISTFVIPSSERIVKPALCKISIFYLVIWFESFLR